MLVSARLVHQGRNSLRERTKDHAPSKTSIDVRPSLSLCKVIIDVKVRSRPWIEEHFLLLATRLLSTNQTPAHSSTQERQAEPSPEFECAALEYREAFPIRPPISYVSVQHTDEIESFQRRIQKNRVDRDYQRHV